MQKVVILQHLTHLLCLSSLVMWLVLQHVLQHVEENLLNHKLETYPVLDQLNKKTQQTVGQCLQSKQAVGSYRTLAQPG